MAYNHQQAPFWDFVRAFSQNGGNGAGVDHRPDEHPFFGNPMFPAPAGTHPPPPPPPPGAYPFAPTGFWASGFGGPHGPPHGPGPHGHRGGRGRRHGRRDHSRERSRSRTASPSGEHAPEGEQPEGENREVPSGDERRERHCPRGYGRHRGGRGGWGNHGRRGPAGPPPYAAPGGLGGFDLSGLFAALNSHPLGQQPWAQMLRQYAEQAAGVAQGSADTLVPEDGENSFVPPVDVFSTENAYIVHIALPGAKKEDVGVNYDSDKGVLNVAGIVYRQGDEEFLKTLTQGERKVGIFDRSVNLPPAGDEKEEVDGDAITAKLEDGVLVVTVPKAEKEWTDVKKVDIA